MKQFMMAAFFILDVAPLMAQGSVDDYKRAFGLPRRFTADKVLDAVTDAINEYRHDDWIDVYHLRMIKHGPKIYIDMHVVFPRKMTVQDIADEVDELEEAVSARYGDSIEISVNPVPCCEFNCRNCCRNCFDRGEDFERKVLWTSQMLCCSKPHAVDPRVIIRK